MTLWTTWDVRLYQPYILIFAYFDFKNLFTIEFSCKHLLALGVGRMDNGIHQTNHYLVDRAVFN